MTILLGPVVTDDTVRKVTEKGSGRTLYRKQILREGSFNYKGSNLDLTADRCAGLVQSFKDGAFDEVPFQFGGTQSEHNNDPKLRGGTLSHMEHVPGKGVFGYFDLSEDAVKYVTQYPRFGVSPRIELGIERADGKKYDGAIQHVLGTLIPRLNGMSSWEKVELSAGANTKDNEVIDFSGETYEVEDAPEIDFLNDKPVKDGDMPTISNEDLALLKEVREERALIDSLAGSVTPPPASSVGEGGNVQLSQAVKANADAIEDIKRQSAAREWASTKALLLSQGVPPHALEMAEPVMLTADDGAIELSSGEKTTSKVRTLGLLEGMKGTVDLSDEKGHQVGTLGKEEQDDLDQWINELGLNNF